MIFAPVPAECRREFGRRVENSQKVWRTVTERRCPRFVVESDILLVSGAGVELRVPIRRCLLGEQMTQRLLTVEAGREIAHRLLINGPSADSTGSEIAQEIRVAFGPDLEPIHAGECTVQRCVESCSPAYKEMLQQFGLIDEAEQNMEEGCYEETPDAFAAVGDEGGVT